MLMPAVLYADSEIVVVDKPANLLSVPGRGPDKQDCLWKRVQREFPTARIVHRLDYATSGVMVLALDEAAHRALSIQFQERRTAKRYQAIVAGTPAQSAGEIDLPLRCDWERRPRQMVDPVQGKPALTRWEVIERTALGTRLALHPVTGRSHQLRVHLMAIGHPILGDHFYASQQQQAMSDRLLLHAEYLGLFHPRSGDWCEFSTPCPF
jgi:tRNA pseudouridine32 synthase/23S rRNA pseudouridine746 synthase